MYFEPVPYESAPGIFVLLIPMAILVVAAPRLEERGRVTRAFEGRGVDVKVVDASQRRFAAVCLLRRGDADSGNVGSAASASIEQDLSMHQIGPTLA